jgi:pullulanase
MRKDHPAFRMTNASQIEKEINFLDNQPIGVVAYTINGVNLKDSWKNIIVFFNGTMGRRTVTLPTGNWKMAIWDNNFGKVQIDMEGKFYLDSFSCTVLFQER